MSKKTPDGAMESADGETEAPAGAAGVPSICPAINDEAESGKDSHEQDPFAGSAEDIAADETRRKSELYAWANSVRGLQEFDLELALQDAEKRFNMNRRALERVIAACAAQQAKEERRRAEPNGVGDNVKHYSFDFKVSDRGVFARRLDDDGHPFWDQICTTRIDIEALTRDEREGNWGTYIVITNRDGGKKKLAVPHALTAADKVAEITSLLASLGVGIIATRPARQLLVQFLTVEVKGRITAVPQIGWHCSNGVWVFVLPDDTIVPAGFDGPRPVLQTSSLHVQHGLDVRGSVEEWIEQIARPLAGNTVCPRCSSVADGSRGQAAPMVH
jgi:hypothetical protein